MHISKRDNLHAPPSGCDTQLAKRKLAVIHILVQAPKTGETITLSSTIVAWENKKLIITTPVLNQKICPFGNGWQITIQCSDLDAMTQFDSVVLQEINKEAQSYLLLEQRSEIKRFQRRQDFRLDCLLDGMIECLNPADGKMEPFEVIATNISGGGTAIYSPVALEVGESVFISLSICNETVRYHCEVRRCVSCNNGKGYTIGLKFTFESEKQKDWLVAQIFKIEREKKKRIP